MIADWSLPQPSSCHTPNMHADEPPDEVVEPHDEPHRIAELLDRIPGADERIAAALADAAAGRTIPLEELTN